MEVRRESFVTRVRGRAPVIVAGVSLALMVCLGTAHAWTDRVLKADLLRADPDAAARAARLSHYAERLARPAYAAHCASCHGASMRGDPGRGAPNLVDADWLYGSGRAAEIEQTLLYGIRSGSPKARNQAIMPAFARAQPQPGDTRPPLTPQEVADVTRFVLFLGHRGVTADPDRIVRGRHVFAHRGGCYDCHAADGGGDSAIGAPNLTDGIWLYGDGSAAAVARSIRQGRQGVCPAWSGRLPPAVIRALAVYLHNAAAPSQVRSAG